MRILSRLLGTDRSTRPFIALVSPSVRTLFGRNAANLNGFLRSEGARAVYPVDSGISEFARRCAREIAEGRGGLSILSACPAARPFIEANFPAFASRILSVPSPMMLRARAALDEPGLEDGFAVAVTPCVHKKSEQSAEKPEMMVFRLDEILSTLKAEGRDLSWYAAEAYDGPEPEDGLSCRIAEAVVDELKILGRPATPVRLDGGTAASAFFSGKGYQEKSDGASRIIVAEVDFCEGGCSVPSLGGI